jgi:polyadenylation factor subunit 2
MSRHFDNNDDEGAFRRRRPRPVTDYGSSMAQWIRNRKPAYRGTFQYEQERPSISYIVDLLPPHAQKNSPAESVPVRHLHTSLGKSKKPVTIVRWLPEGRRLLAGFHNGEFMVWNGMSFNFESVTITEGGGALRAAEWSNGKDTLIAANDDGIVFYFTPTLNKLEDFQLHSAPIRDLAWAPTDTKFVTASDDNTLKVWDFNTQRNESTFTEHGWDVKACDWHPTKGLVVSGSKDHSVRLWDPRTGRNLTTLHGHKNAVTATVFSRLREQLLATSARDGSTRIFDLRMMRDVAILRGHEKGVTALSWHPIHPALIATGGDDGALHSYLLSEPNTPPSITTATISPYNTADPKSSPAQSIYPTHRITYAHESSIWSLDWHPLGHILASGSNDHYTRFWSRAQPGNNTCFKDQYHLGEEGAEAQGTWDRKYGDRKRREAEEQEEEDEKEGLEEQRAQPQGALPGLPGLGGMGMPGLGNLPPPPPRGGPGPGQGQPFIPPNMLQQLVNSTSGNPNPMGSQFPHPLPHLPPPPGTGLPPGTNLPPMPGKNGPPIDLGRLQQMQLPQGFPPPHMAPPPGLPPGLPPNPTPGAGIPGLPGLGGGSGGGLPGLPGLNGAGDAGGSVRRRGPLPSQEQGFKMEQARGNFRTAR